MIIPVAGVYDLAGENISGIYDLSNDQRISRTISTDQNTEKQDGKTWFAIHRQKIIILGVVTTCLIVGIGIPVVLLGGNFWEGSAQSTNTNQTIDNSSIGKYIFW